MVVAAALGAVACGRSGGGGGDVTCVDFGVAAGCYCQAGEITLPDDQIGEERGTCSNVEFVPDTRCCARADWGGEQMFESDPYCSCSALRCGDDGFGNCTCTYNPFSEIAVGLTSCTAPVGGVCCVDDIGFCTCSDSTSCNGTLQVSQCDASALACTSDDIEVTTCDTEPGGGGGGGLGDDGISG